MMSPDCIQPSLTAEILWASFVADWNFCIKRAVFGLPVRIFGIFWRSKMGDPRFVRAGEACKIFGISPSTLRRYRKTGGMVEGVHFVFFSPGSLLYKRAELANFFENLGNEAAHAAWLRSRSRESGTAA